jgi:hypothetical protein
MFYGYDPRTNDFSILYGQLVAGTGGCWYVTVGWLGIDCLQRGCMDPGGHYWPGA